MGEIVELNNVSQNENAKKKIFKGIKMTIFLATAIISILFVGSFLFFLLMGLTTNSEVLKMYGVEVRDPEIISGEFIDLECVQVKFGWDEPIRTHVELIGADGQKTILPISGNECPSVSIGGKNKKTTIIYEKCGYGARSRCEQKIVKSIIE